MITGIPFIIIVVLLIIASIIGTAVGAEKSDNRIQIPSIIGIIVFAIIGIIGWSESYDFTYMPSQVTRVKVDKSSISGQNFGYVDCKEFQFSIPLVQTNLPLGYNKSGGNIIYTFYEKNAVLPDSLYVYKLDYRADNNIFLKSNKKQFEIVQAPKVDYELCIKMSGDSPLVKEEVTK